MRRKVYGQSKIDSCPFCGKIAVTKNPQSVPVCLAHKKSELSNLKCSCGSHLDIKTSKWGPFGLCMHCGPINFRKVLELNPI